MRRLSWLLCLAMMLGGCSSLKFWGDDDASEADVEAEVEASKEPKELLDFVETVRIRKLWRSSAGKGQDAPLATLQPGLLDDHVYSADPKGRVTAFTIAKGKRAWRTDLNTVLTGGVGVAADQVLVGSQDGDVYALDADTGEQLWRAELTGEILAPPTGDYNIVVVQTQDGKVHGLSADSGKLVWQYVAEVPVLTLRGTGAPTLAANAVIVGFANGKVVALNALSGELQWEVRLVAGEGKTELERMVDVNTPLVVGDLIYLTSYQGKVGAVSRGVGRELWTQKNSSYHAPGYGLGRLYVADTNDKVYSFRASGGQQLWLNEEFLRRKLTSPLAVGDHIAIADREGYLHILSFEDGQVVGRVKVDGDGVSVPMVSNQDTFFVLDNSGDLTAYQLEVKD
ncbi:MAG: outer membrane protein assembly factor BamB [Gammaproteobacteria bacterium]|nr:MAG: outer membrane protein assembly factor BamB [Gammaproteobacteria bacterium]RLA51530.1 MAG: outer membrane protein assembly factor BamB [Gammaproteobacteria bacterium]